VARNTALDLAELVSDLREYGRERNLIVAVVDQLQRDEPTYQREVASHLPGKFVGRSFRGV
jgi:hypothetical protein